MAKVYLSPSNQTANTYAYGNTNEAVQCGRIASACKVALERSGVQVKVGQYDTMQNRCKASDAFGADIHCPIHTNAFNGSVMGTRIFSYDTKGKGWQYANKVFDVLAPLTPGKSENVKPYPELYEVKNPKAPAVYIEVEFHDSVEGVKWIVEHTTEIGEAIAEGLCNALGVTFKKAGATEKSDKLYRIQVGAFSVKANADAYLKKVKAAGFPDAYIVEVSK